MSKINKFLNKTAVISGLVVASLIVLPMTASSQQRGKNKNRTVINNNVVVNNGANRGKLSLNRGMGGRQVGYNNRNRNKAFRRNARANNRAYNRGYRQGRRNNGGAFVGGLFTGAIISSAFNNRNTHVGVNYNYGHPGYGYGYGYPGYRFAPRTNVVYVERPVQTVVREVPVYQQQNPYLQSQNQYQPTQQQVVNNNCLQSREYTTTIEIGGEAVPAYGQACLQPDGSWKFGDPVAVPSF